MPSSNDAQFRYDTGELVMEGDEVICDDSPAVIEQIFAPRTSDAGNFECFDTGGILVRELVPRRWGLMQMTPPDGEAWEDLVLVRRKLDPSRP